MKVYIVTIGEYSDYRIEEVFLTKEKAELYINAHKNDAHYYDDDYNIEEYNTFDDKIYEEKDKKIVTLKYDCSYDSGVHYNVEIMDLALIDEKNITVEDICIHTDYLDCRKIESLNFTKIVDSNRVKTEEQYEKILQDIVAEAKNMLLEYNKNEMTYKIVASIEEALEQKYL